MAGPNRTTIREVLVARLQEEFPRFDRAAPDDLPLVEVIDSAGIEQLVLLLIEEFGVQIKDSELVRANLGTVTRLVSFVERKLNVARV